MTPEERVDAMVRDYGIGEHWHRSVIAAAIREAVDAERERCATIAESTLVIIEFTGDHAKQEFALGKVREMANKIVEKIRGGAA